jgi:hypothetical protein
MNPDKTYTYNPHWTMDTIPDNGEPQRERDKVIKRVTVDDTDLPGSDCERGVQPLPFFWWLNPWRHMELLFDAYKDTTEVCNAWRRAYHLQSAEADRQRQSVYDLRDELATVKGELDASKSAVRNLRNQRKKPSRK